MLSQKKKRYAKSLQVVGRGVNLLSAKVDKKNMEEHLFIARDIFYVNFIASA
jgi:hypothetical protein